MKTKLLILFRGLCAYRNRGLVLLLGILLSAPVFAGVKIGSANDDAAQGDASDGKSNLTGNTLTLKSGFTDKITVDGQSLTIYTAEDITITTTSSDVPITHTGTGTITINVASGKTFILTGAGSTQAITAAGNLVINGAVTQATATGGITANNITINNGTVTSLGDIAATGTLSITGKSSITATDKKLTGEVVSITGGSVVADAASITASSIETTTDTGGAVTLSGHVNLGATAITANNGLTINAGAVVTSGAATLATTTGSITIAGTLNPTTAATIVTAGTDGDLIISGPVITSGALSAARNVRISSVVSAASVASSTAGSVTITPTGELTTNHASAATVSTTSGNILVDGKVSTGTGGTLTATAGTVTFNGAGSSVAGLITGGTGVTVNAPLTATAGIASTANDILINAPVSVTAAAGLVAARNLVIAEGLSVSALTAGVLTATNGYITIGSPVTTSGNVSTTSGGGITISSGAVGSAFGTITAATGDIKIDIALGKTGALAKSITATAGNLEINGEFKGAADAKLEAKNAITLNAPVTALSVESKATDNKGIITITSDFTSSAESTAGVLKAYAIRITGGRLTLNAKSGEAGLDGGDGGVYVGEDVTIRGTAVGKINATGAGAIHLAGGGHLNTAPSVGDITSVSGDIFISTQITATGAAISSTSGNIVIDEGTAVSVKSIATTSGAVEINGNTTVANTGISAKKLTVNANVTATSLELKADTIIITRGNIAAAKITATTGGVDIQSDAKLTTTTCAISATNGNITISGTLPTEGITSAITSTKGDITLNTSGKVATVTSAGKLLIPSGRVIDASTALSVADTLTLAGELTGPAAFTITGHFDLLSSGTLKGAATSFSAGSITFASKNIPAALAPTASTGNLLITASGITVGNLTATLGNITIEGSTTKTGTITADQNVIISGKVSDAGTITATKGDVTITADVTSDAIKATAGTILVDNKAEVKATVASTAADADALTAGTEVKIINGAKVTPTPKGTGKKYVVAPTLTIKTDGTLVLPEGEGAIALTDFTTSGVGYVDVDGTAGFRLAEAPVITDVSSSYLDGVVTVLVSGNYLTDLTNFYLNNVNLRWSDIKPTYAVVTEAGEVPELGTWTFTFADDGASGALLGLVSDYGVYRNYELDYPSPGGGIERDGAGVRQPAGETFRSDYNWLSSYDAGCADYVYSDDTLRVTFTFARAATKNVSLIYGGLASYLSASTDILPAGRSTVDVVFTFKKLDNEGLRSAIVARAGKYGAITAQVNEKDDDGTYGIAEAGPLTFFNALSVSPTIVVSSIGYEGSVDLGISGGSDVSTMLYLPWKGLKGEWVPAKGHVWTSADKSALFAAGGYVLLKDPNTDNNFIRVDGPNSSTGGGSGEVPVLNHGVYLVAHEFLVPGAGLHYSAGQSFSFDVKLPASTENKVSLTIVGVVDNAEVASGATWSTIPIDASTVKVLVTNITTDIRITIGFTTGIDVLPSSSIWSSANTLTIESSVRGLARIYSLRGSLVKELSYNEGSTSVSLPIGIYFVTLSDGSSAKVVLQ